ncbi:hypothetical protein [Anabaena sp. CCY 9910]|uniref:hypothetical protein n=1 Tax=Anabaena sp. CCY 9910 TaxID=3103870 RepID=UPI0039DFB533
MKQDFLTAGYRQFQDTGFRTAECLLQKRIYDVIGTKYFLNAYEYIIEDKALFECEARFTKDSKLFVVTVSDFKSVEEVEDAYHEMWEKMGFDYQELNS